MLRGSAYYLILQSLVVMQCWATIPRFFRGRPRGGLLPAPKVSAVVHLPEEEIFMQRLTHFNDADQSTWRQRYWHNSTFWKPGGPVFIMIGGEGRANPIWVVVGSMMKYAEQLGAMAFLLEHRFYGESHPLGDMSDDSLQYLNSEQALADVAAFITAMKVKFKMTVDNKWICFGGSYPGSLSAWFRLKFPHLVVGAVATSAPIKAQLNFDQYLEVVTASLRTTGNSCVDNIADATTKLQSMILGAEGRAQLTDKFRLCKQLTDDANDISNFASSVAGNFMGVVQYNKDNRKFEGALGTNITIDVLCSIMTNRSNDNLSNYASVNSLMLDTYGEKCLDISYSDMINDLKQTSWNSSASEGGRQWTYQTCTEFGFYQTSDSLRQPFGSLFPLKVSVQQCMDVFGTKFNDSEITAGIQQTNTNYGGLNIAGTKIVFPNGSIDPWHALGVTSDVTAEEQAIFIEGTAHCANMYPASPNDPEELVHARELILEHLTKWLK